jgi:hypothetical protein
MRVHSRDFDKIRSTFKNRNRRHKLKSDQYKKENFVIEALESRLLLSATAIAGLPSWID